MTDDSATEDRLRGWMDANRLNWDDRVAVHLRNRTGFYPIDRVRAGDNAFGEPEDSELGDLAGKRLIHLQCHFGLDTICLARRGAITTALDFSHAAIVAACALAADLDVPVRFVEGNVYGQSRGLGLQATQWSSADATLVFAEGYEKIVRQTHDR